MKNKSIGITTATILGLKNKPYYIAEKCFWSWDIRFKDYPLFTFCHNMFIYMGETWQEANETKRKIMAIFNKVKISEGSRVSVIYHGSDVIAIGRPFHDCWVDLTDGYKIKKFKELWLKFDELFVACD